MRSMNQTTSAVYPKQKQFESNHILDYVRNEIGLDHFYIRERRTILCRIDEETLGLLDDMEQPSSVSDGNKSRISSPKRKPSFVISDGKAPSVRKANTDINIINLTSRDSNQYDDSNTKVKGF